MPDEPIARLNAALEGRYRIERQLGEGVMATAMEQSSCKWGLKAKGRTPGVILLVLSGLALSACGDSPTTPAQEHQPVEQPDPQPEVPDHLLSDDELRTSPSANELPLDTAWVEWVIANVEPVRSLTVDDDYSDLSFLAGYLGDRRIVQLGESGHGVAEFDEVKVRLIKYLHEELGFDVIAFESSLFECYMANRQVALFDASVLMGRCIFPVWHTFEVYSLFEYIKETQATDRPLILTGFDSQVSSRSGVQQRPGFFEGVVSVFNSTYASSVRQLDSDFINGYLLNRTGDASAFASGYQKLLDSLDAHRSQIDAAFPEDPRRGLVARQTAWSMTQFVAQLTNTPENGSIVRDMAMATNFDVLADSLYADQKIINWAHNYHVAHDRGTMGQWVHDSHGSELYTIGLYMYQGHATWNDRQSYEIPEPTMVGLESILHRARIKYLFVDLLSRSESAGTSWMFEEIDTREWGVNSVPLVSRDQYDGVLWIHTVREPSYVTF